MADELDPANNTLQDMNLLQTDQEDCLRRQFPSYHGNMAIWIASQFPQLRNDTATRFQVEFLDSNLPDTLIQAQLLLLVSSLSLNYTFTHYLTDHILSNPNTLYAQRCQNANAQHPRLQSQTLTQDQIHLHPMDHPVDPRGHVLIHETPHPATQTHHQQF
jgi:hypothetical protein